MWWKIQKSCIRWGRAPDDVSRYRAEPKAGQAGLERLPNIRFRCRVVRRASPLQGTLAARFASSRSGSMGLQLIGRLRAELFQFMQQHSSSSVRNFVGSGGASLLWGQKSVQDLRPHQIPQCLLCRSLLGEEILLTLGFLRAVTGIAFPREKEVAWSLASSSPSPGTTLFGEICIY